jgi:hypothetical protein
MSVILPEIDLDERRRGQTPMRGEVPVVLVQRMAA